MGNKPSGRAVLVTKPFQTFPPVLEAAEKARQEMADRNYGREVSWSQFQHTLWIEWLQWKGYLPAQDNGRSGAPETEGKIKRHG